MQATVHRAWQNWLAHRATGQTVRPLAGVVFPGFLDFKHGKELGAKRERAIVADSALE